MMISCSKGHQYTSKRLWCPDCGELNFVRNPKVTPSPLGPFLIHKVPRTVRLRFKEACHAQKRSVRGVVVELMDQYATAHGFGRDKAQINGPEAFWYGPLPQDNLTRLPTTHPVNRAKKKPSP